MHTTPMSMVIVCFNNMSVWLVSVLNALRFNYISNKTFQGLAVDQNTVNQAQAKIDSFTFSSLWFSGLASLLSLVVGQYTAFKVNIFPQ